ncbi:MAG: bifunctional DNA-formamidopyrimidine glycosylase/DNA-(apurinic or apyrimidinic site) lyase [Candidatus Nomurabacteria bacterium]|jgi:formamidopyrimidine-DNA glycosylase|nr:bifunctional DNA-formamidopyrimidine glycosylase/DNA-(apurinic or apyrimidinic site) lyase [Candidatus Nomurabacteria bacterium]
MPELPEVETVRRGLEKLVIGQKILKVEILSEKSFPFAKPNLIEKIIESRISAIRRRGKVLIIDLNNDFSLVVHLKMTGQIVFRGDEKWGGGHPTDSFIGKLPDRSTRVIFELGVNNKSAKLFFNDQRKFGWIKLMSTADVDNLSILAKMGPEPWEEKVIEKFTNNVRHRANSMIKPAIIDQTVIAGIGNIYADETLWMTKTHPSTRVKNLLDKKLREICLAAGEVMQKSIDSGGSTMQTFVKADGTRGNYLDKFANVFGRDGQLCLRCGTVIQKIRVAGRGTHICPKCQKTDKIST